MVYKKVNEGQSFIDGVFYLIATLVLPIGVTYLNQVYAVKKLDDSLAKLGS